MLSGKGDRVVLHAPVLVGKIDAALLQKGDDSLAKLLDVDVETVAATQLGHIVQHLEAEPQPVDRLFPMSVLHGNLDVITVAALVRRLHKAHLDSLDGLCTFHRLRGGRREPVCCWSIIATHSLPLLCPATASPGAISGGRVTA